MEKQLIDPEFGRQPCVRDITRSIDVLARRVEGYLRAAGLDDTPRHRLVAVVLADLRRGDGDIPSWQQIIEATERHLTTELHPATPPPCHRAMLPQDLSPSPPSAARAFQRRINRPARGLAACLGWLTVLIIP